MWRYSFLSLSIRPVMRHIVWQLHRRRASTTSHSATILRRGLLNSWIVWIPPVSFGVLLVTLSGGHIQLRRLIDNSVGPAFSVFKARFISRRIRFDTGFWRVELSFRLTKITIFILLLRTYSVKITFAILLSGVRMPSVRDWNVHREWRGLCT